MSHKNRKAATTQPTATPGATTTGTAPICRHCSHPHSLVCTSCGRSHSEHTFAGGIVRASRSGQQYKLICERYTQVPKAPQKSKAAPLTTAGDEVVVAAQRTVSNIAFPESAQLTYKHHDPVSLLDSIPTDRGGLTLIATKRGEMFWVRSIDITVAKEEVTA